MAVSKRLRYEVMKRDGHACRYCGRTAPDVKLTIDHVVPTTLGGSDDPDNLVTACADCNSGKSSSIPDAPLVADVADDALRWARAQQVAANQMLEDLGRRREIHRRFKGEWDRWKFGGRSVDLPDGWESSVENFLAAGLPIELLVDCVSKAMSNPKIQFSNMFRYMCGIAWSRVRDLKNATRSILGSDAQSEDPPCSPYEQAYWMLAGVPAYFDEAVMRSVYANAFDQAHAEDEDVHGRPTDYSNWPADLKALVYAITLEVDDGRTALSGIGYMIGILPEDERQVYLDQAREAFMKADDVGFTEQDLQRYALILRLLKEFPRHSQPEGAWS